MSDLMEDGGGEMLVGVVLSWPVGLAISNVIRSVVLVWRAVHAADVSGSMDSG